MPTRLEHDLLGSREIPADALWGIHTARAVENFPLAGRPCRPALIHAYGEVKAACAAVNRALGVWAPGGGRHAPEAPGKADAIERACAELAAGALDPWIVVDALQGGAGTSLNLNINEVAANRALVLLGRAPGDHAAVHPLEDLNLHQSTNDTFPTAIRLAAIRSLRALETEIVGLQEAFQGKEREFAHIVKVGRTEMQDAVLITLGREFGAWSEAFARDRWRLYKAEERLRVVNLGGTAVGTGLAAPRDYVFRAADALRERTGIGFARAENLLEATQNADVFVEVSGLLKACAASLLKVGSDLRLLSSGPEAGLGEIRLPPRQAGSSIMPGKVNPVIAEAVEQAAMRVFGHDLAISLACARGSLELNPFLPLVADALLEAIDLLAGACSILRRFCVGGIEADEARCLAQVHGSTATVTALLPALGYARATELALRARRENTGVRELALRLGWLTAEAFDALVAPEAVCRLGDPPAKPPAR